VPRKFLWFLVVFPTLLGFDFFTKKAVVDTLPVGGEIDVVPGFLSVLHAQNPDVAFSLPVPLPLIVLAGVGVLALIAHSLWNLPVADRLRAAALGAITAGAAGNLLDRIGDGAVTDFVRVYTEHAALAPWLIDTFGTATWPIFNVADVALLVGVGAWIASEAWRLVDDADDEPELAPSND
jgi:signal peptidase II